MENTSKRIDRTRTDLEESRERYLVPRTDIIETEEELRLLVDLPGVSEKDLNLELKDGTLTIVGKAALQRIEGHELRYREYQEWNYRRAFALSDGCDSDKVEASLKEGVLTVVLPKAPKLKPRKIAVRAA